VRKRLEEICKILVAENTPITSSIF